MWAFLIAGLIGLASAEGVAKKGFNSGSMGPHGVMKQQDYEAQMNKIKNLPGTSGFNSIRLFTMIQAETYNDPTSAIPAAIATNTGLLLGLWASVDQEVFDRELTALRRALEMYGQPFITLIDGIICGSEDLYRISPTGIENQSGRGATPGEIVKYIRQLRDLLKGYGDLQHKIGHVDTRNAWQIPENGAVIDEVDFVCVDEYPYWEHQKDNNIDNAERLFFEAFNETKRLAKGKEVWITETGHPVAGPEHGRAQASIENAKRYWDAVGCKLFGKTNTWWFTLDDAKPDPNALSWSIVKPDLGDPLFDLSCPA